MVEEDEIGAVQLSVRLRGVSPPVRRRLRISEQATLAQLHAVLQVAFDWSDTHLYTFLIRGGQFGDRARGMELTMAGGADIPLAAFGFEIGEPFRYQYRESNARRQDPRAWDVTLYALICSRTSNHHLHLGRRSQKSLPGGPASDDGRRDQSRPRRTW